MVNLYRIEYQVDDIKMKKDGITYDLLQQDLSKLTTHILSDNLFQAFEKVKKNVPSNKYISVTKIELEIKDIRLL